MVATQIVIALIDYPRPTPKIVRCMYLTYSEHDAIAQRNSGKTASPTLTLHQAYRIFSFSIHSKRKDTKQIRDAFTVPIFS